MPKFFKSSAPPSPDEFVEEDEIPAPEPPPPSPSPAPEPPPSPSPAPEPSPPPDEGNDALPVPPADVTDADHQIGQGATPDPNDPAVIDPLHHLDDAAQPATPPAPGAGLPDA